MTCFCGKPYAARPMIECSKCLTWLHFSCAKIKRNHIPDIFICIKCTNNKLDSNHEEDEKLTDIRQLNNKSSTKGQNGNEKLRKSLQPLENLNGEITAIVTSDNTVSSTVDSSIDNKADKHVDKHRSNRKTV